MRRFTAFVLSLMTAALVFALCVRFVGHLPALNAAPLGKLICLLPLGALAFGVDKFCNWAFKKKFWGAFVGCSAVVTVLSVVYAALLLTTPSPLPEQSIQEARNAYLNHDLASFKNYVDVNSILSDGFDQLVVSPVVRNAAQSNSDLGGLLAAGVAATAAAGKQVYLPELSQEVEQFVVTGSVQNQSQDDAFGIAAGSEILRMLAISQLRYDGIENTRQISDSVTLVTVRVRNSVTSKAQQTTFNTTYGSISVVPVETPPVLITLKLRAAGDHWQIVSIQNLPDLAKQLLS
jgi:hypothetical protein